MFLILKIMMAENMLVILIISLISVHGAPSELISKLKEIAKVESDDVQLVDTPYTLADDTSPDSNDTQGIREKRWFNYYGFPPMNPIIYPSYPSPSRDDGSGYGQDDPLSQIYKRLQDIADFTRQQPAPPPLLPQQFPIFFPVIFIPAIGCGCTPAQNRPDQNVPQGNGTSGLDFPTRFPDMDDPRQNWGFVINDTEVQDDEEEDFTRPISFVPVMPNRTLSRPPPPVEHGSSQAGAGSQNSQGSGGPQGVQGVQRPQAPASTTTFRPTTVDPFPQNPSSEAPTICDGAVLSCCHQQQVTYDCFAVRGCPDPSSYGNPCDSQVILRVIDKYQRFYVQRNG